MAFENVFGQVDFRTPERKQVEGQRQFMQMLGMGMQQAQHAQRMDLQERQLAAKGEEFDLESGYQKAMMKAELLGPESLDKKDLAFLTVGSNLSKQQYAKDEVTGNLVPQDHPMKAYVAKLQAQRGGPVVTPQQFADSKGQDPMAASQAAIAEAEAQRGANRYQSSPGFNMPGADNGSALPVMEGVQPATPQPDPMATLEGKAGRYTNSPNEMKKAGEAVVGLEEYAAKMEIELKYLDERQKRDLAFQMARDDAAASKSKALAAPAKMAEFGVMSDDINRALAVFHKSGLLPKSGIGGDVASWIGNTNAGELKGHITTIKANVGLGKMDSLRENSVSGSSGLGSLSEEEMKLLTSVTGNLDVNQKADVLQYNLKRLYNTKMDLIHGDVAHIAKVAAEKGLSEEQVKQASFRYPIERSGIVFNTPEELQGVNLPPGTIVNIGGRTARIK